MTRKEKIVSEILKHVVNGGIPFQEIVETAQRMRYGPDASDSKLESVFVEVCRAAYPKSRGEHLWRYAGGHRRGTKARRACRWCEKSTTWDNSYPRTRQSQETEDADTRRHIDDLRSALKV